VAITMQLGTILTAVCREATIDTRRLIFSECWECRRTVLNGL